MLDSDSLYRHIGNRIRLLREMQTPRMSQGGLADVLGLKRTSITNIESGTQKPTLDTLYRLCEHFGIEVTEVIPAVGHVTRTEGRSVVIGGKAQELGMKTATVIDRIRPQVKPRR